MTATFRAAADAIAYALGEPPQRTDWAIAYVAADGETTFVPAVDEAEARRDADDINLGSASLALSGRTDRSHPVRAYAAFQEVRVLPDGTQIIGPWHAPADQFLSNER
ncbi:hypothetical protein O7626_40270 [Micromonospora sp. WMMD1102]|uniref:hypothetical protein n=1 Tax=Micromonospora sp. WMMD1102 TaxID=3016105 RepID=UPI002414EC2C|nr:hypothetical protein [Micromonospora sp. WMMD1102]MDG4792054.1 hypothetical protein [Micromonospora sp. WMMD1102]